MKHPDPIGDRMKGYEAAMERTLDHALPIIVRLDGRAWSSWTGRCCEKPYDPRLHALMAATTKALCQETGAHYGYTQSDEITLVLHTVGVSQPLFGARVQKLTSLLASWATAYFATHLPETGIVAPKPATFDCRVFNVPTMEEAVEAVLWREADAQRNSTLGRGQEFLSAAQLHGMTAREVRGWLLSHNKAWEYLPVERRYGAAFHRRRSVRPFTTEELEALPPKHNARSNPALLVERQDYLPVALPLREHDNPTGTVFL